MRNRWYEHALAALLVAIAVLVWSPALALSFVGASVVLAVLGALPASALAASRDHAKALQI